MVNAGFVAEQAEVWTMSPVERIRLKHRLARSVPVVVRTLAGAMSPDGQHTFDARVSAATLDRDDELLLPAGCDASEFHKSGCIHWNHDYARGPIGFPLGPIRPGRGELLSRMVFLRRPEGFQGMFFPDFVRAVVTQAHQLGRSVGVSVGFIPVESRLPTMAERKTHGDRLSVVVSRWKLLEWSIAPVQSNPSAYTLPSAGRPSEAGHAGRRYVIPVRLVPTRKIYIMPVRMPAIER